MDRREDGTWYHSIEITATSKAALAVRVAAVNRALKKVDKGREKPRRAKGEGTLFRRRSDGMYIGRYQGHEVSSMDRARAVEAFEELKANLAKGVEPVDKTITLEKWLNLWIEEIAPGKTRPHALKSYRSHVRNQLIPAIGDRKLGKLQPDDVRALHKWIREAKYARGKDKATGKPIMVPYTERTVEAAHTVLSSALKDAVAEGKAHRNVCELVPAPDGSSGDGPALTTEQARSVLLAALKVGDPMVTRWAAGLMLGGRQGELLGLQWDRVDLDKGTLDLAWQLEWLPLKDGADSDDPKRFDVRRDFEHKPLWRGAALTRPKTELSQRMIPLPAPLAAILEVHRKQWMPNPWGLVWASPRNTPISDSADRAGWRKAQARVEVEPVQVRYMRNTTATLLMEAQVPDKVIQSILGHTNVLTTRGYQRVNLSAQREALGNLDALLAG